MSAGGGAGAGEEAEGRVECPVCGRGVRGAEAQGHVDRCLFLNSSPAPGKRPAPSPGPAPGKRRWPFAPASHPQPAARESAPDLNTKHKDGKKTDSHVPLAERARPASLDEYVGQAHVLGQGQLLRGLLERGEVPSMILWGPPGCGKTSLAHVIASQCKSSHNMRFVKLSATMSGIADVKDAVNTAKNEMQFKRRTVLFMDEIHRFNKLQQDTFLPHVENGTIVLIGATTENPSFSLNNALLSRCRVIVLEKLSSEDILTILERAVQSQKGVLVVDEGQNKIEGSSDDVPRAVVPRETLVWLAEVSDGDARVALSSLQLALQSVDTGEHPGGRGPPILTLEHIKEGIKRSHTLYDRKGDAHYDTVSALHKSIRASDDNAALYWLTRMMQAGEDPLFIARRLVRAAAEDIGLAEPSALSLAVSCMQGCQLLGMPECDVLLAQCAVHLARAPKSQEVYRALLSAKRHIAERKGPTPPVPLHLRNAPTKLMSQLGCGVGYNMRHKNESGLQYMPPGLEHLDFFADT